MTDITIRVHPATVPTTASPFHPSATHVDTAAHALADEIGVPCEVF